MDNKVEKQAQLDALYAPYKKCMMCPLGGLGRKMVVFGDGNPDAQLLFVAEAPGQSEDEQGLPFVGKAGRFFDSVLADLGIDRSLVYITNIVKCRPPKNRAPKPVEMQMCKNLLLINQVRIIQPKVICTLGSIALQGLLGEVVAISQVRGKLLSFHEVVIVPTYHPAYVARTPQKLNEFVQDVRQAFLLS